MLDRFVSLVNKLRSTTGRLEKEGYLAEYKSDYEVKEVLYFLFNPYIVTGISDKKLFKKNKSAGTLLDSNLYEQSTAKNDNVSLLGLLEYFRKNNSGRDVDVEYLHNFVANFDNETREIIFGLVKKDLKLGIQEKTLNKVFGNGFIPVLNVMLAESWEDNKEYLEGKEFLVKMKLDGVRCVLIFNEGTPVFYSRGGRPIEDLVELAEEVKQLNQDYVYDGELLLSNPRPDMNIAEIYRATVKITSSDNEKRGVDFNIFDRVIKNDFIAGISIEPAIERVEGLSKELSKVNAPHLKDVGILHRGSDTSQIPTLFDKYTANGEEGLMLVPSDSPYECKRTKNLLKVKKFHTADVLVLSMEEGTGANKGKLGAVHVKFIGPDKREHTCKVGSGFKQEDRELYFANPDQIIGKIIEIGYFEVSKNQNDDNYSLRFPTFKHVRNDKDEISMY
ncbi:MAG: hypothetical protein FWE45_03800 [Firmicutes bacterium]|nr:hypothetical protein [Bacillota bacterium]